MESSMNGTLPHYESCLNEFTSSIPGITHFHVLHACSKELPSALSARAYSTGLGVALGSAETCRCLADPPCCSR